MQMHAMQTQMLTCFVASGLFSSSSRNLGSLSFWSCPRIALLICRQMQWSKRRSIVNCAKCKYLSSTHLYGEFDQHALQHFQTVLQYFLYLRCKQESKGPKQHTTYNKTACKPSTSAAFSPVHAKEPDACHCCMLRHVAACCCMLLLFAQLQGSF